MIGNAIVWLSMIWVPMILYIMLANETKFKKNIAVGVTLPFEGRRHPDVTARLAKFKRQELWVCMGLIAAAIPGILMEGTQSFTFFLWWIVLVVVLPHIPYVLCNRDLKRIKAENGWNRTNPEQLTVDLSAVPRFRWLSPMAFLPALALSLLPLLWERDFAVMYLIDGAFVVLAWLGYRYLFRQKSEQVDDNSHLTQALTRIRQCQWGKMWLLCAYAMAALNVGVSLTKYNNTATIVLFLGFTAVLCGAAMYIEFRTRKLQETLTANSGTDFYVDDDDKWLGGIVYYNPNDNRLLINNRVGTNSSINLAKPAGKIMYALLAVLIVSMPLWGMFLSGGELTPKLTETELQVSEKYTIPLEDVTEVTLLTELPPVTRVFGTGLPNYLEGTFTSPDYGKLKLCLDPTAPPFLLIETDTELYLVGTRDRQLTQDVYEAMK